MVRNASVETPVREPSSLQDHPSSRLASIIITRTTVCERKGVRDKVLLDMCSGVVRDESSSWVQFCVTFQIKLSTLKCVS